MRSLKFHIGRMGEEDQLKFDFEDGLMRSVQERIELGFIFMKLPIIDEAPYRVFDKIEEYRKWADKNLPNWLGYNLIK
jgi:hypothetical protein